MKKFVCAFLCASLLSACACAGAPHAQGGATPSVIAGQPQTAAPPAERMEHISVTVEDPSAAACTGIDSSRPTEPIFGGPTLAIRSGAEGAEAWALIRIPLPAGIRAEQVQSAYLEVCMQEGGAPLAVQAGMVRKAWTTQGATWDTMHDAASFAGAPFAEEAGEGWYRFDIAAIVQSWLRGDAANYGVALTQAEKNKETVIHSLFAEDASKRPRLEIAYTPAAEAEAYGKYAFTEQAEGNCLSYALRDTSPVYMDALVGDEAAMQGAIDRGEGVQYFSGLVLAYVEQHKDAMGIANIRAVAAEEPIDAEAEYRVALRLGFREGEAATGMRPEERNFDFHLRAQLRDGSWTEKFPKVPSRVVPGTNAENSLNQFPWDANYQLGNEKFQNFYSSEVVYYAVTKTTDGFTAHLGGGA